MSECACGNKSEHDRFSCLSSMLDDNINSLIVNLANNKAGRLMLFKLKKETGKQIKAVYSRRVNC